MRLAQLHLYLLWLGRRRLRTDTQVRSAGLSVFRMRRTISIGIGIVVLLAAGFAIVHLVRTGGPTAIAGVSSDRMLAFFARNHGSSAMRAANLSYGSTAGAWSSTGTTCDYELLFPQLYGSVLLANCSINASAPVNLTNRLLDACPGTFIIGQRMSIGLPANASAVAFGNDTRRSVYQSYERNVPYEVLIVYDFNDDQSALAFYEDLRGFVNGTVAPNLIRFDGTSDLSTVASGTLGTAYEHAYVASAIGRAPGAVNASGLRTPHYLFLMTGSDVIAYADLGRTYNEALDLSAFTTA